MAHFENCPTHTGGKCNCLPVKPFKRDQTPEKVYTIVIDHLMHNDFQYLIVRRSDIGAYVEARCHTLRTANLIAEALEKDAAEPPAF